MTPTVETSYRASPRVILMPGDQFTVGAGPYYRLVSGEKVPLAARGRLLFVACHRKGQRVVIEAREAGGTVMIHVAGRRRSPVPGLVARPYKIRRKLRSRLKA